MQDRRKKLISPASAALVLLAALWLAYGNDAGRGFIKDDFRWIRETRVDSTADVLRLFERSDGFYRPLVSLSFALNSAMFGLAPRPYGWTNLLLVAVVAVLVWMLARALGLNGGPAVMAAAIWAFNFHGINMAVLWISGRTSLIVTLFAVLTALALLARRPWLTGLWCLLALLSKEEAALLPLVAAAWSAYETPGTIRTRAAAAVHRAWPCFAALAIYLILRFRTDAFWPGSAPAYYRLSASVLATNVIQYADRAITWAAVAALIAFMASGMRARLDAGEKRIVAFAAIWLVGTFALTVLVPVRSSLYAVMPSVGAGLAAAAIGSAALRAAPRRTAMAMAALALLPLLLVPVYWRRNERWVRLADLSTRVLDQVRAVAHDTPARPIVLVDDPAERFNLDAAYGALWPDAAVLFLPPGTSAVIGPTNTTQNNTTQNNTAHYNPGGSRRVVLRLVNGRLVREH